MDRYTERLREKAFEYGIKRLAADLDMSESRLYKKLDPDQSVSLTLNDFFRMNRILNCADILQPMLDDLGMTAVEVARCEEQVDEEVKDLLLDQAEQTGNLTHAIRQALADHVIDDEELQELREFRRESARLNSRLMARLEQIHAKGKGGLRVAQ